MTEDEMKIILAKAVAVAAIVLLTSNTAIAGEPRPAPAPAGSDQPASGPTASAKNAAPPAPAQSGARPAAPAGDEAGSRAAQAAKDSQRASADGPRTMDEVVRMARLGEQALHGRVRKSMRDATQRAQDVLEQETRERLKAIHAEIDVALKNASPQAAARGVAMALKKGRQVVAAAIRKAAAADSVGQHGAKSRQHAAAKVAPAAKSENDRSENAGAGRKGVR